MIKKLFFPVISDKRGNLTFIESKSHIPFQIDNVHWIYNILNQGLTNKSAFKQIDEVIIALSGSFDILVISKDNKEEIVNLNYPNQGIYVPKMTERKIYNFSTNAVALVLESKF